LLRFLVVAHASVQRFPGLVLLMSLVVGTYLRMQEIDRAIEEGALLRLLCERPSGQKDDLMLNQRELAEMQPTRKEIEQSGPNSDRNIWI